jgi:hypothetical protein
MYAQNVKDVERKNASKFASFEKAFSKQLSSAKDAVKLIGFRTYRIEKNEKGALKQMAAKHDDAMKHINMVVSEDYSFYRIYFPLHDAIVVCWGELYNANEKGVFIASSLKNPNKLLVVGRKKTATVRGTSSDLVMTKHRVLLGYPFRLETQKGERLGYMVDGNTYIFDLSAIQTLHYPRTEKLNSGSGAHNHISCLQNHGGRTSSETFDIHQGRSPKVKGISMDYNGWQTTNKRETGAKKHLVFPGSDCSVAVCRGYCWNEL